MTDHRNEMTMLADFGDTLDRDFDAPPAAVRDRVLAETHGGPRPQNTRPPGQRWRPRLGWSTALAAGVAASLAIGLALIPQGTKSRDPLVQKPAAPIGAATILHNAALAALHTSSAGPRPDQFVFSESLSRWGTTTSTGAIEPGVPTVRQVWLSADGTGDGLLRERPRSGGAWDRTPMPGCRHGQQAAVIDNQIRPDVTSPCEPVPGYNADLATSGAAMLSYLRSIASKPDPKSPGAGGAAQQADDYVFKAAAGLVLEADLAPAVRAAVFDAVAALPGVRVVHGAVDAAGRTGVAVARDTANGEATQELIFDPNTYLFYGVSVVGTGPANGAALLRTAVVDQVGLLP